MARPTNLTIATFDLEINTRAPGAVDTAVVVEVRTDVMSVADLIRSKAGAEWDAGVRPARESAPPCPGEAPNPRSREEAVHAALDAFRAGWFVVFVNDAPVPSLDERLSLRQDSQIHFVRLYPYTEY